MGATGTGFALVTLAEPVAFGDTDNDPIDILVFMAAHDSTSHVEDAMCQVADFCDSEQNLARLRSAKNVAEVVEYLKSVKDKY
jgi:PTS system ascorbate-specific IIA component